MKENDWSPGSENQQELEKAYMHENWPKYESLLKLKQDHESKQKEEK